MQDLSFITEDQTAEVELTSPVDDAKLGAFFTFAGPSIRSASSATSRARASCARPTRRRSASSWAIPRTTRRSSLDDMVAATLGWRCSDGPFIVINGEQLVYSAETCRRLYADAKLAWIRRWALQARERRGFYQGLLTRLREYARWDFELSRPDEKAHSEAQASPRRSADERRGTPGTRATRAGSPRSAQRSIGCSRTI
jgi:hypothetical protein